MTEPIYDGCGSKKTCFGFPSGCVESKSCTAVVSCLVEGERYEFDMKARNSAYVAVGLSQDAIMVRLFVFFVLFLNKLLAYTKPYYLPSPTYPHFIESAYKFFFYFE